MTPDEQAKLIEYVVSNQFIPELGAELNKFLAQYREKVIWEEDYKKLTGYKGQMIYPKKIILDLTVPQQKLITNIIYAIIQKTKVRDLRGGDNAKENAEVLPVCELSKTNFLTQRTKRKTTQRQKRKTNLSDLPNKKRKQTG